MAMGLIGNPDEDISEDAVVAEINITPLTDIFLVLLIIFMVTSTALVEREIQSRTGVRVSLPSAQAAGPLSERKDAPVLTLTQSGDLYVGSRKVAPSELEDAIRQALKERGSDTLLLRGDQAVLLGKAVDVMSIAKRAGAAHLGIVALPKGTAAPPAQ